MTVRPRCPPRRARGRPVQAAFTLCCGLWSGKEVGAGTAFAGACGWIVDLRDDRGGALWPMPAVGAGAGRRAGGGLRGRRRQPLDWSIQHGNAYADGEPVGWTDSEPIARSAAPAVLISHRTGSSGEAVAVAFRGRADTRFFGEPTYGVPTGNGACHLSDGATLVLTTADDTDHAGRTYDGPIRPDEEVVNEPTAAVGGDRDRVLAAARAWLHQQPGCQRNRGIQAG
ncbi:S41 family peptidase [Kitasatospora aureofaciens]|uniref:S41 family peptidase n=1 Tax=Kitasatospora aureofaciens TaxID=1894 RepID=UPI0037C77796